MLTFQLKNRGLIQLGKSSELIQENTKIGKHRNYVFGQNIISLILFPVSRSQTKYPSESLKDPRKQSTKV